MGRDVLSFGSELELVVAFVPAGAPDPDAGKDLAPILRVPDDRQNTVSEYVFEHIRNTLQAFGITLQDDNLPRPDGVDPARAQAIFGVSVKYDGSITEAYWNGYSFMGVEINSSASWTSDIAFRELRLIIQVLLRNYRIRTNCSTGLQFHIGNGLRPLNTQTIRRAAALFWCLDPILCHVHPPQRRRTKYTLSIREYSRMARAHQDNYMDNATFFKKGRIGKPKLGRLTPTASSRRARKRCFPDSRVATLRADPEAHARLENEFPDGFGDQELLDIPVELEENKVDSALDGAWRCLACEKTDELRTMLLVRRASGSAKPNYSLDGYMWDQNPEGQDEWEHEPAADAKLTIELREAIGSMDAEWVVAWGHICTSVVLFAQNASTAEFFRVLMRLAQAQGDFGDHGPAPYDAIDFLDDIGCFAEAELLEHRLQDKKRFWFPCRYLNDHLSGRERDPNIDDRGGRGPSGWSQGFGNEGEERPSQQGPPEWSTAEWSESQTLEFGDLDLTNMNFGDLNLTDADSGNMDFGNMDVGNVDGGDTKAGDMDSYGFDFGKMAAYLNAFPRGWERIPTSGSELLCGLHALRGSIEAQASHLPVPTIAELQDLINSENARAFNIASGDSSLSRDQNNFRADQLAGVLQEWGRQYGENLRLGFVWPNEDTFLFPAPDGNQRIIWIWNDGAQDLGILGHYEGLRSKTEESGFCNEEDS